MDSLRFFSEVGLKAKLSKNNFCTTLRWGCGLEVVLGPRFGTGFEGPSLEFRLKVGIENSGLGSNLEHSALGVQSTTGVTEVQGPASKSEPRVYIQDEV